MRALTNIANAEFWKAFRREVGTQSARDFLWLTVFFVLVSYLTFLGWSAHQGLWERFQQVLLGSLPNSSPPIRLNYDVDRPEGITAHILTAFRRDFHDDLSIVPIRDIDGQSGPVVLPGLGAEAGEANSSVPSTGVAQRADADAPFKRSWRKEVLRFRAFALSVDAPIWQWALRRAGRDSARLREPFPMVVAASRTLFKDNFSYETYRAAVVKNHEVPCVLRNELPEHLKNITDLKFLVLEVNEGGGRTAFHRFDVIWIDSFPMPEQIAFIMPLSTVEALVAAQQRPKLEVNLESHGRPSKRILRISLKDIDRDDADGDEFRTMATCLGAVATWERPLPDKVCGAEWNGNLEVDAPKIPRLKKGVDFILSASANWPLRQADVASCAKTAGLGDIFAPQGDLSERIEVEWTEPSPAIEWRGPARVEIPCSARIPEDQSPDKLLDVDPATYCKKPETDRGIAWLDGYWGGMVYQRLGGPASGGGAPIDDVVDRLLRWKPDMQAWGQRDERPVFRLDAAYQSALVRFGVLSTIIDRISAPLGLGLLVLYFVLSYVILATAFLHRRAQYGLLAMAGLRPWQIEYIACIQIGLACLIGCVVGYLGFVLTVSSVNNWLADSKIIRDAGAIIGLDIPVFLGGLTALEVAMVWAAMTFVSLCVGCAILILQGISNAKAPIDLIKS